MVITRQMFRRRNKLRRLNNLLKFHYEEMKDIQQDFTTKLELTTAHLKWLRFLLNRQEEFRLPNLQGLTPYYNQVDNHLNFLITAPFCKLLKEELREWFEDLKTL